MSEFAAILFDAGGVLVLPDPTVIGPLLAYYGGDPSIDANVRAHYAGMAAKSRAGSGESDWHEYNHAYVASVGVDVHEIDEAADVLSRTRTAHLWRWPIPSSVTGLRALHEAGIPIGVVSNASGQIESVLARSGVCQVGEGDGAPVMIVVDSHHVGVAKPDPRVFAPALDLLGHLRPEEILYVGDSVTMDVGGARAVGMVPVLVDPFDDHPNADFLRIRALPDLLGTAVDGQPFVWSSSGR